MNHHFENSLPAGDQSLKFYTDIVIFPNHLGNKQVKFDNKS